MRHTSIFGIRWMWNSPSSFMLCCANVLGLSEELVDLVAERENILMAQSPKLKPTYFGLGRESNIDGDIQTRT